MPKTDYLTKPYGERPMDPVARDAFDFLMEHGAESGAGAVIQLADFIRKPRCLECGESICCYECAAQGGPGADLLPQPEDMQN
ncbi:MAG: hypothetical protein RIB80_04855 [Rhodospirillales bacterium]